MLKKKELTAQFLGSENIDGYFTIVCQKPEKNARLSVSLNGYMSFYGISKLKYEYCSDNNSLCLT